MTGYRVLSVVIGGLLLPGCTANPNAPINQTFPIRQMDGFFNSISASPPRRGDTSQRYYAPVSTHEPGYAPAYPPY